MESVLAVLNLDRFEIFLELFLFLGSSKDRSPSRDFSDFTLCTIFGRRPGFEPELLRLQQGVLPMSYTHPFPFYRSQSAAKATRLLFVGQAEKGLYIFLFIPPPPPVADPDLPDPNHFPGSVSVSVFKLGWIRIRIK